MNLSTSSSLPRAAVNVSVVVPVYNGASALPELCRRVAAAMTDAGLSFEVVLVDDNGSSQAWPMIASLAAADKHVRGIRLSRNFGQHAATVCGIAHAQGEWIATIDDDLEHPPEAIPAMIGTADVSHPLVYGRFPHRTHARYRNLSSELMRWTLKRAFPDINDNYSSFRCMHRSIGRELVRFGLNRPYIDGMLSWITSNARTLEVEHGEREHGESAYTFKKLISHAVNVFVTFSHLPLRLATFGGLGLAVLSFLWIVYLIYGKITGGIANPGYTSLMSVVLFACGIQLVILGVLGEYIGKLMGAAYRKPVYVVATDTDEEPGVTEVGQRGRRD
ncbi:glycosyltransferase family 2 protein [Pinirhizobacter soli]|uniref:glycosyltransferase family 2 protein n=1 Tax=Pinirhizobacter soli TaxID=2786953 RepID=UPI00202A0010|nr:glycosyltransferase family 2 protein [Pinirhizobacter soli]